MINKNAPSAPDRAWRQAPAGPLRYARIAGETVHRLLVLLDRQIPEELRGDPQTLRHGRLITRFGLLGAIFGLAYAVFYLLIGHRWGADIILVSTMGVAVTPLLMMWSRSIRVAGHFFSLVLTLGFLGLCFVEGGVHGHAIAWLANVPLCALLLLGTRAGALWAGISLIATCLVVGLELEGVYLPIRYDPRWSPIVSAAGYLGLVTFMFILGYIFESGRARAEVQLRAALEKLARSNERLVHLNSEKDEFLGIAAHDLKNPLTVILAGADLMRVTRDLEEISPIAGGIIQAAERMRNLISNLLDVHAIENGQFASNLERCELGGVVGEIVGQNRAAASQKKIAIELAATEGLVVETDRAAAVQILDNLISNAVKYSPLESRVRVEVGRENGEALVAVRDEGPGISAEDQKKLFQKYGRLSARPTGGESSNGLGLAIAKRLAESLSGTIECRSVLGEGATFTLRLPLSRGEKLRES